MIPEINFLVRSTGNNYKNKLHKGVYCFRFDRWRNQPTPLGRHAFWNVPMWVTVPNTSCVRAFGCDCSFNSYLYTYLWFACSFLTFKSGTHEPFKFKETSNKALDMFVTTNLYITYFFKRIFQTILWKRTRICIATRETNLTFIVFVPLGLKFDEARAHGLSITIFALLITKNRPHINSKMFSQYNKCPC